MGDTQEPALSNRQDGLIDKLQPAPTETVQVGPHKRFARGSFTLPDNYKLETFRYLFRKKKQQRIYLSG